MESCFNCEIEPIVGDFEGMKSNVLSEGTLHGSILNEAQHSEPEQILKQRSAQL
jgi:hypothetical protein